MSELKQVILIRKDLSMSKGKIAAQAGHACVDAVLSSNKKLIDSWRKQGMKKIALKVENEEELLKYLKKAEEAELVFSLITDAGHTEVEPGTKTCGAIGPAPESLIDKITGELKVF